MSKSMNRKEVNGVDGKPLYAIDERGQPWLIAGEAPKGLVWSWGLSDADVRLIELCEHLAAQKESGEGMTGDGLDSRVEGFWERWEKVNEIEQPELLKELTMGDLLKPEFAEGFYTLINSYFVDLYEYAKMK